jgi:hypothetical protein
MRVYASRVGLLIAWAQRQNTLWLVSMIASSAKGRYGLAILLGLLTNPLPVGGIGLPKKQRWNFCGIPVDCRFTVAIGFKKSMN